MRSGMFGHDRKNAAGAGDLCQLRLRDAGEGREVSGAVWVRGEAGAAGGYVRLVGALRMCGEVGEGGKKWIIESVWGKIKTG